jgi:transposase
MRIVAGVDCHKAGHTIVFVDGVGQVVEHLSIPTTPEGYERALEAGQRLGVTEWGVEGTGCYGFAFAVFAAVQGATVLEVPGSLTKRHRSHGSRRGKSDQVDGRAIAEVVLREEGRLAHFHPAVAQRALRLRYERRDRLVRERTRAANRLRMAAVLIGVVDLPGDITSTKVAQRLATSATRFITDVELSPSMGAVAEDLLDAAEDIVRLNGKIRTVERALKATIQDTATDLTVVHGVSTVVAAGLIGHAGDLRNYRNAAAFASKCGVAPVPCSSGRNVAMRVNTGGDRQLNRLLHVVAMAQVAAKDHPGRRYYDRKRAEGKTHLGAMRCLKRHLATVVFYRLSGIQRVLDAAPLELSKVA